MPNNHATGKRSRAIRPVWEGCVAAGLFLAIAVGATALLYHSAREAHRDEVHAHLLRLTHAAASLIDGDLHRTLVSADQYDTEPYNHILRPMRKCLQATPGMKYFYTVVLKENLVYFGVDSALPVDGDGDGIIDQSKLMEVYAEPPAVIWSALREGRAVTTPEPYTDKWGTFITGLVPVRDSNGELVCVAAVDLTAEEYQRRLAGLRREVAGGLVPITIVGLLIGIATWSVRWRSDIARRRTATLEDALRAERDSRETALQQSVVFLQQIMDTIPNPVFYKDTNGRYLGCNQAFAEFLGRLPEQIVGATAVDIAPPESAKTCFEQDEDLPRRGSTQTYESQMQHRDGTLHEVLFNKAVFEHTDGSIGGIVGVILDITERKQAEEQVRRTNVLLTEALKRERTAAAQLEAAMQQLSAASQEVQAANRSKSEFLANMSHEIRTPMTAILGFAENLMDPSLSEIDRQEAISTIRRNGEHLLAIINDILDISKVEAGKLQVEQIACSPSQILAEVASLMRVRTDQKRLSLAVEYVGPIPESIRTDPLRLRQILVNLVGNAVKFTAEGGVRLVARCLLDGEPAMQFDIIDTGVGMTQEQAESLFQPFQQADASTTRQFGGSGLGLSISRRLARILGGDVTLTNTQPDVGTSFRVTIATGPLEHVRMLDRAREVSAGDAAAKPVADHDQTPLVARVLLAEDGPDNQVMLSFILRKAGAQVTVVENGKLALDAARDAQERGEPFDVILMDMQMPVMDGYTATGLLRTCGYRGPIIALTAHAMSGDREHCLEAGCSDYVAKPINRQTLIDAVRTAAGGRTCPAATG